MPTTFKTIFSGPKKLEERSITLDAEASEWSIGGSSDKEGEGEIFHVVYGHGLSEDRHQWCKYVDWNRVMAALGDEGTGRRLLRFLTYDARGHGGSSSTDHPEDYSWPSLAADQWALVHHVWPPSVDVEGGLRVGSVACVHGVRSESQYVVDIPRLNELGIWFETDLDSQDILVKGIRKDVFAARETDIQVGDVVLALDGHPYTSATFETFTDNLRTAMRARGCQLLFRTQEEKDKMRRAQTVDDIQRNSLQLSQGAKYIELTTSQCETADIPPSSSDTNRTRERPSLIITGASMGCGTALFQALAHPDAIAKLVLVIPSTAWEHRPARKEGYIATANSIRDNGTGFILRAAARARPPAPLAESEEDVAAFRRDRLSTLSAWDDERLERVFRGAAASDFPSREECGSIDIPCLILAWSDDALHPTATAEELHRLMPHSSLNIASTHEEWLAWPSLVAAFLSGRGI